MSISAGEVHQAISDHIGMRRRKALRLCVQTVQFIELEEVDEPTIAKGDKSTGHILRPMLIAWPIDIYVWPPMMRPLPVPCNRSTGCRKRFPHCIEYSEGPCSRVLPRNQCLTDALKRQRGCELAWTATFSANPPNDRSNRIE